MRYHSLMAFFLLAVAFPLSVSAQTATGNLSLAGQVPNVDAYVKMRQALDTQRARILNARQSGAISGTQARTLSGTLDKGYAQINFFAAKNGGPSALTPEQARQSRAAYDQARLSIDAALGPDRPHSRPIQAAPASFPAHTYNASTAGPCSGTYSGNLTVGCGQPMPCVFSGNLTITCPGATDLSNIQTFSGNLHTCVQPARMPQTFSGQVFVDPSLQK